MIPPGIEPGTFRVLGGCDNHYTTESLFAVALQLILTMNNFSKIPKKKISKYPQKSPKNEILHFPPCQPQLY